MAGASDVPTAADADETLPPLPGAPASAPSSSSRSGLETRRMRAALAARMFGETDPPVRVGRFVLIERLGQGGMGVVYAAWDPQLDRRIAVKVLLPRGGPAWTEKASARLLREAQAMAQLRHPNVLTVHDAGTVDDGSVFIAMEYVEGHTLASWCRAHPPSDRKRFEQVLGFAIQAARGLVAAHRAGLVHRDLKPANLLVDGDMRVRVADFGLARAPESTSSEPFEQTTSSGPASPVTSASDAFAGTPAYMAPEQFAGVCDARTDQWSLCATLWEAAYGCRPFGGETLSELAAARLERPDPPPPERREVPRWFRDALTRGLAPVPDDRHADVEALLAVLLRGRRRSTSRMWALVAGLGLGVAATAAALLPTRAEDACASVSTQLDAMWPTARRDALREVFVATGRAHAQQTFDSVQAQVEGYANAVASMRHDACEAGRRGELSDRLLDARAACLDGRARQLDAILRAWERGLDGAVLDDAPTTIPGLPGVEGCADAERLLAIVPPPPEHADAVAALEAELDDADARLRTGGEEEVAKIIAALVERAEAIGYARTLARALRMRGHVERVRDPDRSLTHFTAAAAEAVRARDPELEALALLGMGGALHERQRADEAQWVLHGAALAIDRAGASESLQVALLNAQAENASLRGDPRSAAAAFEELLAIVRVIDPDGLKVAQTLYGIATAAVDRGDAPAAVAPLQDALAHARRVVGDEHPATASLRLLFGTVLVQLDRPDEGAVELAAARDVFARVYGEQHRHVAGATMLMARVHAARGDHEAAVAELGRAIEIFEHGGGDTRANVALALSNRGIELRELRRYDDSERDLQRSLSLREALFGPKHPDVAESLTNLANLAWAREDFERAVELHERSLAIHRAAHGDAPATGIALLNLGMSLAALKRWPSAVEAYEESVTILGRSLPEDDARLAMARRNLDEARRARGDVQP